MIRILQITAVLLGTLLFAPSAEACSCLPPTVQSSYNNNDHTFAARALSEIVFGGWRIYQMEITHPGNTCRHRGDLVTVGTNTSSAACGTTFSIGHNYLVFANDVSVAGGTAWSTNICAGNRLASTLTRDEINWLRHREVECSGMCLDPSIPMVSCLIDPCTQAVCLAGTCEANYCGGCNAEFYDSNGYQVCVP